MLPPQAQPPVAPMLAPQPVPPPMPAPDAEAEITMTAEQLAEWWGRVDRAIEARKHHEDRWEALLKAYMPPSDGSAINSNIHFRNTEQKKGQLFFKTADFILTPLEPLKDQRQGPDGQMHTAEDVVSIKQAVLKQVLGPSGINLKRLMDEQNFDVLQVAGLSPSMISYECDLVEVEPDPDPLTGLVGPPVKVPVFEEWCWKRFSPKKLLIPHDWRSTRYDEAPWLGMQFVKPLAQAQREYDLPEDFAANASSDTHAFEATKGAAKDGSSTAPMVEGVAIWYFASHFDVKVAHRQVMRRLVLIKGLQDRPAKHTKSPYQTLGPDGKLTADSMIGNPIHILTLRDLADSAYVPSDSAMTDPLVKQENTWASQDIALRDANIPRFLYDGSIAEAIKKLQNAAVGEGAEVEAGKLQQGIERLIAEIPRLEKAQADVQGRAAIKQMISETLGLGANQGGSVNDKVLSATEISSANNTAGVRIEAEQNRELDYVIAGARKIDALIQRFADSPDYVSWVGADGAKRLTAWDMHLVAGRFAYEVKPDSQLRIDLAQKRQQDIQFVNLMANAPEANRSELLRTLARDFGYDPTKVVVQPPAKTPDMAKGSISFKIEDFIGPGAPVAAELAAQCGYKVSPQALQAASLFGELYAQMQAAAQAQQAAPAGGAPQTEHGGALDGAGEFEPISKHAGAITGAPSGRGPM